MSVNYPMETISKVHSMENQNKNKVTESIDGLVEIHSKEIGKKMYFMVMESIDLLTDLSTKEILSKANFKVRDIYSMLAKTKMT